MTIYKANSLALHHENPLYLIHIEVLTEAPLTTNTVSPAINLPIHCSAVYAVTASPMHAAASWKLTRMGFTTAEKENMVKLDKGSYVIISVCVLRSSRISRKSAALIVNVRYSQKKELISIVFYCSENPSIAHNLGTTGLIQVGFSAKCTSPNEHFIQIEN